MGIFFFKCHKPRNLEKFEEFQQIAITKKYITTTVIIIKIIAVVAVIVDAGALHLQGKCFTPTFNFDC